MPTCATSRNRSVSSWPRHTRIRDRGSGVEPPGARPGPGGSGDYLVAGIVGMAEEYTTLDPAELTEHHADLRKAAYEIGDESPMLDDLLLVDKLLADWHGDAADEFMKQRGRIEVFMTSQSRYAARAVQALDAAYMVSVHARESFYSLAQATIAAAEKAMDRYTKESSDATVAFLVSIPKAVFDVAVGRSLGAVIGAAVDVGKAWYKAVTITGDAAEVANEFAKRHKELLGDYKDAIDKITTKVADVEDDLINKRLELLEPLPRKYTDISSPDFSYENFYSPEREEGSFGSKVDKAATDKDSEDSDSDIRRRLDDDGKPMHD